jgi:5-methylcytosine-specific restriction endonuclease McrA
VTNPAYRSTAYQTNRRIILARSGGHCFWPGCTRLATTADHITPLAKGGTHDLANLRAACRRHNSVLGAQLTNQIRAQKKIGRRSRTW